MQFSRHFGPWMHNMKILTPISHLANDHKSFEPIARVSDELEARERTSKIRLERTTHYHIDFDLNIGLTDNQKDFLRTEVAPREEIHTLTFQASKDCEEAVVIDGVYQPRSRVIGLEEQVKRTRQSIVDIQDIVGSNRSIRIENNNYYPGGAYGVCTSLDYLEQAVSLQGCGLLLDIAHAKVTCFNRRLSANDYISRLLDAGDCNQIHLCEHSIMERNGCQLAIDSHGLPTKGSTQEALELIQNYGIGYLTIEYYKNPETLADYLKCIRQGQYF